MVSRLKTLCRILVRHRFLLSAGLSAAAGISLKSIVLIPVTDPLFATLRRSVPAFMWHLYGASPFFCSQRHS